MKIRKFVLIALPIMLMSVWISPLKAQMTKQQAEQYTTNKLLRALSEASKKPPGETKYQRRQRLDNLTKEMQIEDAAISQQQIDYNQASMRQFLGDGVNQSYSGGGTAPSSDYERRRAARLNGGNATTSAANPNAKPAGFGAGYAGGYKEAPPAALPNDQPLSGITTNAERARRSGLGDITAGDVIIVRDDQPATPLVEKEYCKCKGSDHTDITATTCINLTTDEQYLSGYYPMTSQCFRSFKSHF